MASPGPLLLALLLLGIAVLTGLVAHWLFAQGPSAGTAVGARAALLIASVYTAVIGGANIATSVAARRIRPIRRRTDVSLHVLATGLATLLSFLVATEFVGQLFGVRFSGVALPIVAVISFAASLIVTGIVKSVEFYRRMLAAERAILEAELSVLRAQINPHFLFNALNSIATLIPTRPAEAERAIEDLADLFRYSLQASKHPTVTLAEELESVMLYLSLERARFPERLEVTVRIPDELLTARVPSLILQPLVENAVKHGAERTNDPCTVTIEASRQGGTLEVAVGDTGPGFFSTDRVAVFGRGDGLANVARRIDLLRDDHAGLQIRPNGVHLRLPFEAAASSQVGGAAHEERR